MTPLSNLYDYLHEELRQQLKDEPFFQDSDQEVILNETRYPLLALFLTAMDFGNMHNTGNATQLLKDMSECDLKKLGFYRVKKRIISIRSPEYRTRTFERLTTSLLDVLEISEKSYDITEDIENLLYKVIHLTKGGSPHPTAEEMLLKKMDQACLSDFAVIFRTHAKKKTQIGEIHDAPFGFGSKSPFVRFVSSCYQVAGFPDGRPKSISWLIGHLKDTGINFNAPISEFPKIKGKTDHLIIKHEIDYIVKQRNFKMKYLSEQ